MAEPAVPQVIALLLPQTHSLEKWEKLSSEQFLPVSQKAHPIHREAAIFFQHHCCHLCWQQNVLCPCLLEEVGSSLAPTSGWILALSSSLQQMGLGKMDVEAKWKQGQPAAATEKNGSFTKEVRGGSTCASHWIPSRAGSWCAPWQNQQCLAVRGPPTSEHQLQIRAGPELKPNLKSKITWRIKIKAILIVASSNAVTWCFIFSSVHLNASIYFMWNTQGESGHFHRMLCSFYSQSFPRCFLQGSKAASTHLSLKMRCYGWTFKSCFKIASYCSYYFSK